MDAKIRFWTNSFVHGQVKKYGTTPSFSKPVLYQLCACNVLVFAKLMVASLNVILGSSKGIYDLFQAIMNDKRSQFSIMNDNDKMGHNNVKDSFAHKPVGLLVYVHASAQNSNFIQV